VTADYAAKFGYSHDPANSPDATRWPRSSSV
jgi:hypothetical protein